MKVLNLRCAHEHVFEGWFASEDDFIAQQSSGLLECPICGSPEVSKALSAPRLNLRGSGATGPQTLPIKADDGSAQTTALPDAHNLQSMHAAWLHAVRHVMAHTEDVGSGFAEEARRIHYGEAPERGIRGRTSSRERQSLLDEGIDVMPLLLPKVFEGPMQ